MTYLTAMTHRSLSLLIIVASCASFSTQRNLVGGFTKTLGSHYQQTTTSSRLMASRLISSFEAQDFAGETGEWPYSAADMGRIDSSDDGNFYDAPRFVTHIDDRAIESLTNYYREEMSELYKLNNGRKLDVLDLCSSWISHYPTDMEDKLGIVAGIGMNEEELIANKQLYVHYAQDLNKNPSLAQFEDNSFDIITNVVSVDYLTKPLEIFKEMHRVLRPGGRALMSFSNRCFPSKAVAMWLQADDIGRLSIVGSYFHYSAKWEQIDALDVKLPQIDTPTRPSVGDIFKDPTKAFAWASAAGAVAQMNSGDPLFVVKGVK